MSSLEEIREERIKKLNLLKESGMNPYPARTKRSMSVGDFFESFSHLEKTKKEEAVSGRVMSLRRHGGSIFADIYDGTGKLQIYFKSDEMQDENFSLFDEVIDVGDFIEVSGTATVTKTGQESLLAKKWTMLAKSLRPLPEKWHGLQDEEERFRRRYLDAIFNSDVREMIEKRAKFWSAIRKFLDGRGFLEVETPVLETTVGGAEARPFTTHHNALDIDVYLRISAGELWQKKLMVAGFPKVYEIGRIFRNEGMSTEHLQDYTQLEFYQAYADYRDGMDMIVELYRTIASEVFGMRKFTTRGAEIDLDKDWEEYDYSALMKNAYGFDPRDVGGYEDSDALALLKKHDPDYDGGLVGIGRAVDILWKKARKELTGPGFLINVPIYLEPLAKRNEKDTRVVERFQVILAGSELGKGFSELNDPIDQKERFLSQQAMRDSGDEEAQMADMEYVEALEYGMPPTFGFGLSERLFAFLMDMPVREAQIFPLMKPK